MRFLLNVDTEKGRRNRGYTSHTLSRWLTMATAMQTHQWTRKAHTDLAAADIQALQTEAIRATHALIEHVYRDRCAKRNIPVQSREELAAVPLIQYKHVAEEFAIDDQLGQDIATSVVWDWFRGKRKKVHCGRAFCAVYFVACGFVERDNDGEKILDEHDNPAPLSPDTASLILDCDHIICRRGMRTCSGAKLKTRCYPLDHWSNYGMWYLKLNRNPVTWSGVPGEVNSFKLWAFTEELCGAIQCIVTERIQKEQQNRQLLHTFAKTCMLHVGVKRTLDEAGIVIDVDAHMAGCEWTSNYDYIIAAKTLSDDGVIVPTAKPCRSVKARIKFIETQARTAAKREQDAEKANPIPLHGSPWDFYHHVSDCGRVLYECPAVECYREKMTPALDRQQHTTIAFGLCRTRLLARSAFQNQNACTVPILDLENAAKSVCSDLSGVFIREAWRIRCVLPQVGWATG